MKYILLSVLIILAGCVNAEENIKPLESPNTDFDIPAGMIEKFKLNNWKFGSNQCVEFSLNKPYNTTNFLANVMFYVKGKSDKEISKIMLFTEHRDSKLLTLAYIGNDKDYRIIQQNINFGEVVKFNIIFTNNQTIGIKLAYSEFSIPLKFKINSVIVGASSSQATAKILEKPDCNG